MKCFTHAQVVLRAREHPRVLLSCPIPTFFCSILLYSQNFEYHVSTLENLIKYSFHFKVIIFSYAQMLILLIQLTVFAYFEACRKLNSVCWQFGHFSYQSLFLSLKFLSLSQSTEQLQSRDAQIYYLRNKEVFRKVETIESFQHIFDFNI